MGNAVRVLERTDTLDVCLTAGAHDFDRAVAVILRDEGLRHPDLATRAINLIGIPAREQHAAVEASLAPSSY